MSSPEKVTPQARQKRRTQQFWATILFFVCLGTTLALLLESDWYFAVSAVGIAATVVTFYVAKHADRGPSPGRS